LFSGEISVEIAPVVPQGPNPPQQVQVTENSPGCLRVTWATNTETDLAGYVLYYGPSSLAQGQTTQYRDSVNVGTARSKDICDLVAGTLYVAVRAFNTGGLYSTYSTEKRIDIEGEDREPPVVSEKNPPAEQLDVPQHTDIGFLVTDNLSGVDISTMEIRINDIPATDIAYSGGLSQYSVTCKPSNRLPEFTRVTVRVTISDLAPTPNQSTVEWSFTTGTSRPTAPQGVTANGTNTGSATVSWEANPEPNVTGYRIYFGMSSVAGGQAQAYDDSVTVGRVTLYAFGGLLDGRYYFALKAINVLGYLSNLSEEVSTTIEAAPTAGPTPPQQVRLTETEPGCVLAKWRANSETDVAGYTVYHRRISEGTGGTLEYVDSVGAGNATEKKICGFEQGKYSFAVKAYNTAGQYSAFSTEKWLDVTGPDKSAPSLVVGGPLHGAVEVPPNTPLFFVLSDRQSGIDASSLSVLINGLSPARVSLTGDEKQYAVVCELGDALPRQSTVIVEVTVRDLATPPNTTIYRWSFSTGKTADTSPPLFFEHAPRDGAIGVNPNTVVRVGVRDKEGVDKANISFTVNGSPVAGATVREEVNGDVYVEYARPGGFEPRSTVEIEVIAYDLAANQALLSFSFETGESGPSVAIVPDGFWADDPARPLEVHNLPPGWQVRIFDTSGVQVRSFTNTGGETMETWTWDFTNGHGRPVAKSLYLVRILDDGGSVRTTGKFVVQTAAR
jgi:hypothetical protein